MVERACYEPFPQDTGSCPGACPVQSLCYASSICIREADCGVLNPGGFINRTSNGMAASCNPCGVSGCAQCVSEHLCSECVKGFTLSASGDKCIWSMWWVWTAVLVLGFALFLWVIVDFVI